MIEQIIIEYLNSLGNAPAYAEVPVEKPSRYFIVEKTGAASVNHIYTATIVIQSYSSVSLLDAMNMNDLVKDGMGDFDSPYLGSVKLNADYNFTNTNTKEYRYQAVFNITLAGGTKL